MSYENPSDFEIDARRMLERLDKEVATLRCLVTGLSQQIRSASGQAALDAVVASALNEAKALHRVDDSTADTGLIKIIAEGISAKG